MIRKDIDKPAMLYAAEEIYSNVSDIKLKNPDISVIEAVEMYIGSKSYQSLSSALYCLIDILVGYLGLSI